MSNKPKQSKTNIIKISVKSPDAKSPDVKSPETKPINTKPSNIKSTDVKPVKIKPSDQKTDTAKLNKKSSKTSAKTEKPLKEVFILIRPFVAFGRYLRDSWRELRQVRWPGRKLTWKMVLAVLIYCAIFIIFILLIDMFFTFIFNLLLNVH